MRSIVRGLVLAVCSSLIALVAIELGIRGANLFQSERRRVDRGAGDGNARPTRNLGGPGSTILHPYLGYARRPGTRLEPSADDIARYFDDDKESFARFQALPQQLRGTSINENGFASPLRDYGAIDYTNEATHVIGVFGGSVADSFAAALYLGFKSDLAQALGMPQESVEVVNFANLGYHQPQQLIALTQAILMRIPFDLVINIDGFNEVAFGGIDCGAGYDPLFPSTLQYLPTLEAATQGTSTLALRRILQIRTLREREARLRGAVGTWPLTRCETAKAAAGALIAYGAGERVRIERELQHELAKSPRSDLPVLLPSTDQRISNADCPQAIVDIWQSASLMMNAIAQQAGTAYLHVVQPNQYLEGSKPLSAKERAVAWRPNLPAARAVRAGYPVLRGRVPELAKRGVDIVDLTQVFDATSETVYIDQCCHVNSRGNRIIFDNLLPAIVRLAKEPRTRDARGQ